VQARAVLRDEVDFLDVGKALQYRIATLRIKRLPEEDQAVLSEIQKDRQPDKHAGRDCQYRRCHVFDAQRLDVRRDGKSRRLR
jgi:hypothetical protein